MGKEKNFVVAAFVRGSWYWLHIVDKLSIGGVSTPASTITLELNERRGAKTWEQAKRAEAKAYAAIVKGIVVFEDWVPPRERVETKKSA